MRIAHTLAVAAACLGIALTVPAGAVAQGGSELRPQSRQVLTAVIAAQLGVKSAPGQADEMLVGASVTCTLVDPAKLAALGAPGLHIGARVTFTRIAADKIRVEADELEPVELTKKLTLRIDGQGQLSAVTS
jgi:hypothetical protein